MNSMVLGMGHGALVLSEVVGAASRREVLGIGYLFLPYPPLLLCPHSPITESLPVMAVIPLEMG